MRPEDFTEAEKLELRSAYDMGPGRDGKVYAVAARAVDLMASRGGTMAADVVLPARLSALMDVTKPTSERLKERREVESLFSALSAHMAALEAEMGQVRKERDEARALPCKKGECRRLEADWDDIAGRCEGAEVEAKDLRARVADLEEQVDRLSRAGARHERERDEARAQVSRLLAAGQALSEHVDKTAGGTLQGGRVATLDDVEKAGDRVRTMIDNACGRDGLVYEGFVLLLNLARSAVTSEHANEPLGIPLPRLVADPSVPEGLLVVKVGSTLPPLPALPVKSEGMPGGPITYPCSPRYNHTEATDPLHHQKVKELSQAFTEVAGLRETPPTCVTRARMGGTFRSILPDSKCRDEACPACWPRP